MKKFFSLACAIALWASSTQLYAQTPDELEVLKHFVDSVHQSLKWETGAVNLNGDMATIQVPQGMRYLNGEQSKMVLTELWGNPPSVETLGMLFPENSGPLDAAAWAFNISFDALGYVSDDDAGEINYDDLLKQMKEEAQAANTEREKGGFQTIEIVGWAAAPYYDKSKNTLHWAKEIKFGDGANGNTLNYDVRILGRKGVLSLNAIGEMGQLDLIKGAIPSISSNVAFTEGNRYADFDSKVDDVAAWTLGGLVAGKVLAKAGFFAIILKFIKPIIIGAVALFAGLKRFIFKEKEQE